ncbi:PDCD2 domain protein [Cordyceps fumosorosea ARSEF 2679]|uniref:PDCD2 domain protein n=1 Tax=Cordyceps fumosorosea (strain ARSEF 2679) TaxID=1081104 RepID=A0A167NXA9_CORFA|nr:PDCD2 domain protein [Cordyceps fumosorosea ARSEF 2679]OAA56051.1 PDCD2 domain protein [Cordyceps fumosorosea ARSEF 2679]
MADYDSDSSDGEFAETNVLLGYASKDADEDTISRIGGRPVSSLSLCCSCPSIPPLPSKVLTTPLVLFQEWLDADKAPSAALARCKVCKDLMVLLLQLNGELPERFPNHDRRIYVFACQRASCRRREGSVRALRGVRVWKDDGSAATEKKKREREEEEKEARKQAEEKRMESEQPKPRLGDALFGGGPPTTGSVNPFSSNANPFSSSSNGAVSTNPFSAANPFSSQPATAAPAPTTNTKMTATPAKDGKDLPKTFAETLSIDSPKTDAIRPPASEPWPTAAQQPMPYPTLYLADADYETLEPEPADMPLPANARIEDADAPETTSAADREAFESAMDTTFQKFADRLAQNPEQVIRYEFGGTPLLCSKTDAVGRTLLPAGGGRGMPRCGGCGGRRTFEVQLTPHAIAELEAEEEGAGFEGMEWCTVVVGVCERDCVPGYLAEGEAGYLEEWAGVQWEEEGEKKC